MNCAICLDELVDGATLPCGHEFCVACLRQYVQSRLDARKVALPCPSCVAGGGGGGGGDGSDAVDVAAAVLRAAATDAATAERWRRYVADDAAVAAAGGGAVLWCANPSCGAAIQPAAAPTAPATAAALAAAAATVAISTDLVVLDVDVAGAPNGETPQPQQQQQQQQQQHTRLLWCAGVRPLRCAACGERTCPRCAGAYDGSGNSDSDSGGGGGGGAGRRLEHRLALCRASDRHWGELAAAAARRGVELKRCPRCGAATEHNAGCLNMSCSCGHRYCWVCLAPYPCPAGCGQRVASSHGGAPPGTDPVAHGSPRALYCRRMRACAAAVARYTCAAPFAAAAGALLWAWSLPLALLECAAGGATRLPWPHLACFNDADDDDGGGGGGAEPHGPGEVCCMPVLGLLALVALLACGGALALLGAAYLPVAAAVALCGGDSGMRHALFAVVEGDGSAGPEGDSDVEWLGSGCEFNRRYEGPLPRGFVVWGRVGAACLYACAALPPALALSLALAPLAPLFLCPVAAFPALATSRAAKCGCIAVAGLGAGALLSALLLTGVLGAGSAVLGATAAVVALALACARSPASSDWAFLGPVWQGVGAPCAAILGLRSPVNPELNPFSGPVPFPSFLTLNATGGWNGHVTL